MILFVIAMEILSIVAHLVLPALQAEWMRGEAARISREMLLIRNAALRARTARAQWPQGKDPGQAPAAIGMELPPGFKFVHDDYRFDWSTWQLNDGSVLGTSERELAGITVITRDPRLAALVARRLPEGQLRFTLGSRTTLVVDPPKMVGS